MTKKVRAVRQVISKEDKKLIFEYWKSTGDSLKNIATKFLVRSQETVSDIITYHLSKNKNPL